jgi:hypothetical protein
MTAPSTVSNVIPVAGTLASPEKSDLLTIEEPLPVETLNRGPDARGAP